MFSQKSDLKLISLVKENPVLYDHNHAQYMDFNAREVAWQKIGDELKRAAADCKVRWINIRDVNRRIFKKVLSNPGKKIRLYKYESELEFMKPFYREVTSSNELMESIFNDDDQTMLQEDHTAYSDDPVPAKKSRKTKKWRKRNYEDEDEGHEEPIASVINDPILTTPTEFDPADPVDSFLMSISTTLKKFTPYHLNVTKSKIFAIVQEHELQQIVQNGSQESSDVKVPDRMFLH